MTATILIIDDSEDDQRLYRRALKDFDCVLEMVSTAEEGFARIVGNGDAPGQPRYPDLILLDYNLPEMDGLSFMERLSGHTDTPIPIIMLTGEDSTKVAVEAMKHGADDYLIKDTEGRYLRLLPSVAARALSAQAQREQTKRLQRDAELLQRRNLALMQSSMDGIHIMDVLGNLVETNEAFCRMLGYTRQEMLGLNAVDWNARCSAEELRKWFGSLIGASAMFQTVYRRKDGELIHVEISSTGVEMDGQGFIFSSTRDITERNRDQEALQKSRANLRALLDNSPYQAWLKDAEGRYMAYNKTFEIGRAHV